MSWCWAKGEKVVAQFWGSGHPARLTLLCCRQGVREPESSGLCSFFFFFLSFLFLITLGLFFFEEEEELVLQSPGVELGKAKLGLQEL